DAPLHDLDAVQRQGQPRHPLQVPLPPLSPPCLATADCQGFWLSGEIIYPVVPGSSPLYNPESVLISWKAVAPLRAARIAETQARVPHSKESRSRPTRSDTTSGLAARSAPMPDNPSATLLLVEDDETGRRLTTQILRQAKFEVREAATAGEALRLVDGQTDLIVLDVQLPDMSGFEVCRALKANPATAS